MASLNFFCPSAAYQAAGRHHGEIDRGHIKARVETPAAVEADSLRIEFVEIVEDAADSESFVVVHCSSGKHRSEIPPELSMRFLRRGRWSWARPIGNCLRPRAEAGVGSPRRLAETITAFAFCK